MAAVVRGFKLVFGGIYSIMFSYLVVYCSIFDPEKLLYVAAGFIAPLLILSFFNEFTLKTIDRG